MPSLDDIIKVTFISELSGVQMSNSILYRIDTFGTTPTPEELLGDLADAYSVANQSLLTAQWANVCMIYENMSAFEAKQILFVNDPGIALGDSHPQNQVLRFNRWGQPVAGNLRTLRSSFSQSGVAESFSTRGRFNDATQYLELQNFINNQQVLPDFGTVTPMLFGITVPAVPGPLVEGYQASAQCLMNFTFLKLASRKTSLCAA